MELPKPPTNPTDSIPVPPGAPQLPAVFGIVGARGSGKSYVTSQMIRKYVDHGSLNRVFLISPTFHTNQHLWTFCSVKPEDAYLRIDQAEDALRDVVRKVQLQKRQWDTYQQYTAVLEKHRARKVLNIAERALLEGPPPPNVPLPRPCVIMDDLSHSKFMSSKYLINLTLRSRHVAFNPQVGLTMCFLVQSLKAGIPRTLRSNVSSWLVFSTKDRSILDDLHQELSGQVSKEQFLETFFFATEERHDYLVVDLTTKDPSRVFRKRL